MRRCIPVIHVAINTIITPPVGGGPVKGLLDVEIACGSAIGGRGEHTQLACR